MKKWTFFRFNPTLNDWGEENYWQFGLTNKVEKNWGTVWVSTTELGRPGWLDNQHTMLFAKIFIIQITLFSYEEVSLEDEPKSLQRSSFSLNNLGYGERQFAIRGPQPDYCENSRQPTCRVQMKWSFTRLH